MYWIELKELKNILKIVQDQKKSDNLSMSTYGQLENINKYASTYLY